MMKNLLAFGLVMLVGEISTSLAADTLDVLFVYGSKPKVKSENKWFGGIHGGHVSLSYDSGFMSFVPTSGVHIFSKNKINSEFVFEYGDRFVFDTLESRYLILSIPIDSCQRRKLDSLYRKRFDSAPYDYAFFGMRCASAAYEIMANADILPQISKRRMIWKFFHPKLLRKMLIRKAKASSWKMIYRKGKSTRKWESDR